MNFKEEHEHIVMIVPIGGSVKGDGVALTDEQAQHVMNCKQTLLELFKRLPCRRHPDTKNFACLYFEDSGELRGSVIGCCDEYCEVTGGIIKSVLGFPMFIYANEK